MVSSTCLLSRVVVICFSCCLACGGRLAIISFSLRFSVRSMVSLYDSSRVSSRRCFWMRLL